MKTFLSEYSTVLTKETIFYCYCANNSQLENAEKIIFSNIRKCGKSNCRQENV